MLGKKLREVSQRGMRKKFEAYQFGRVAEQMGLAMVAGDPTCNLLLDVPGRYQDVAGGSRSARSASQRLDLCASAVIDGRPVELVWRDDASMSRGLLSKTITYAHDARLSVAGSSGHPPFEVVLRKAPMSGVEPQPVLAGPEQDLADPELAKRFRVTSSVPLPPGSEVHLAVLAGPWLHLLWDGNRLDDLLNPYYGSNFEAPRERLEAMVGVVAALERSAA